ncbi:MAG: Xylose isomerase domain protein barrel [Bryobacterales bacterium]|nr:Xylose isomerase domain protein barrel [Bryobacterales bacterium]
MRNVKIGVMIWAGRDPAETLAEISRLDVHCAQLCIPGDLPLECADAWRGALNEANCTVSTDFAAFTGESYSDIPTVQRTVGFVPLDTRAEREQRMLQVSDFAAAVGAPSIATHIGFVPENRSDPDYDAIRDLVRRVCDHAAGHGQSFALETGQEPAEALRTFILDADRGNLGINFDPANMILYGTGDPIEALDLLAPRVLSVHAKDGDWPAKHIAGALGEERALGQGSVGIERFVSKLGEIGYRGPLFIEREASDPEQRLIDIEHAVTLLRRIASYNDNDAGSHVISNRAPSAQ